MKNKYLFLTVTLSLLFMVTIYGQNAGNIKSKTAVKKADISSMLGKPVYQSVVDSFQTRVWIITQMKNAEMLKSKTGKMMGMPKDKDMSMDMGIRKAMMSGTHCVIFDMTNIKNRKEIADTSAKVEIVYPSRKTVSVKFRPMMNYFGSGVSLEEKGEYLFTINMNLGTGYKTTQFKYRIR